jgi:hypothetical protein
MNTYQAIKSCKYWTTCVSEFGECWPALAEDEKEEQHIGNEDDQVPDSHSEIET